MIETILHVFATWTGMAIGVPIGVAIGVWLWKNRLESKE